MPGFKVAFLRFSAETFGEGIRAVLFVLAITSVLFGLWPAIGGSLGVYINAAESSEVTKEAGITTADWTTQEAPSLSWIHVHVTATHEVDVRIVAAHQRQLVIQNESGFPVQVDLSVVAGGGSKGPTDGIGTVVDLGGSRGGPTRYIISVRPSEASRAANITDRDIEYTLTWEVHKLDATVFLMGLVLFSMFFVTEYMLHLRSDMRALARRIERGAAEGGAPARAPSAALPAPGAPYGFAGAELGPPAAPRDEAPPATAFPAPPSRAAGRRPLLGRGAAGQEVPPATEEEAVLPPPSRDPYAPPAYSAFAPPPAEEVPQPEYYAPPPPPQAPAPPGRRAPPAPGRPAQAPPAAFAPAPAPPGAPPSQEPVTRVRCPQCKHIVPVYTAQRPTPIKCPNCGKKGTLTR